MERYDDSLEDIPTIQTYTYTERHVKMSAEVLDNRLVLALREQDRLLNQLPKEELYQVYCLLAEYTKPTGNLV